MICWGASRNVAAGSPRDAFFPVSCVDSSGRKAGESSSSASSSFFGGARFWTMENFPYRLYCGLLELSSESELELDEDKGSGLSSSRRGCKGDRVFVLDSPLPLNWGNSAELRLDGFGSVATASPDDLFLMGVGRGRFEAIERHQHQPIYL